VRSVGLRSVRLPVAPHNESMRCGRTRWFSRRRNRGRARSAAAAALLVACGALAGGAREVGECSDDWAVAERFTRTGGSSGFELPTAIAFVRDHGESPIDRSRLAS
jgi:hypothetical protein